MKMQALWTKVALLGLLVCGANAANASSLVISGGDGNPAIAHITPFSVTFTATVPDPPQDTVEATISGPTWRWSGSGSGLTESPKPLVPTSSYTLNSGNEPHYGGGQKNITISCTATYTSTDRKTGATTPIPVSNSKPLTFFVRVPVKVIQIGNQAHQAYNGPTAWGQNDTFLLGVRDNQSDNASVASAQPYGFGLIEERFSNVLNTGPLHTPSTWRYTGGDINLPSSYAPVYQFTDYVGQSRPSNPGLSPSNKVDSWTQSFSCLERFGSDPNKIWGIVTPLNSHDITVFYQDPAKRVVN